MILHPVAALPPVGKGEGGGYDSNGTGEATDLLVESLHQVGPPDRAPGGLTEMAEHKQIF